MKITFFSDRQTASLKVNKSLNTYASSSVIFSLPSSELDESLDEIIAFETILRRCLADSPSSVAFFFSSFKTRVETLQSATNTSFSA